MSEAPTINAPSSTTNLASSDLPQVESAEAAAPAATATEPQATEMQDDPTTPKVQPGDQDDDIPMVDISPQKDKEEGRKPILTSSNLPASATPDASADVAEDQSDPLPIKPEMVPFWRTGTVVDPGTSPPRKVSGGDAFAADTDKVRIIGDDEHAVGGEEE